MNMQDFILKQVDESNRIENQPIPITDMDPTRGHLFCYHDALFLGSTKHHLSLWRLRSWQAEIVREQMKYGYAYVPDRWIGALRDVEVYIGDRRTRNAVWLKEQMDAFLGQLNQALVDPRNDIELYALCLVASSHLQFEHIHPFIDGNGRTGRVLAFYVACRLGIPPVLFTSHDKHEAYYPTFTSTDADAMYEYCKEHQVGEMP